MRWGLKVVRIGTKQEVHPKCDDMDLRLVFEIKFVKQLFPGYRPVHLNIWRTFTDITDTTLENVIKITDIN